MKTLGLGIIMAFMVSVSGASAKDGRSVLPKPRQIEAKSELKPHIGFKAGVAGPRDYDSAVDYGVEAGFQPYIPFAVGVELSRFSTQANGLPNLDRTKFLGKATYNLGGNIPVIKNTYAGAEIGPVFDTFNGVTYVRLGTGLLAGADFLLGQNYPDESTFSLGLGVSYLWVTDTDSDNVAVNGSIKYWF